VIPTLPLRLRNRLAGTILSALREPAARRELAALAESVGARHWLAEDEARWAEALAERARRASAALAGLPPGAPRPGLAGALEDAALLFDAGLHFEVHEVLEPHWAASEGDVREALQGLIQAAVGLQHLANANLAGARSLLLEAAGRLHGRRLLGRDLEAFAHAAAEAAARLERGEPVSVPAFPR
jgi:DUF309 family protein family protein